MTEDPLEHRSLHDRQQLLRCRVSERPQAGPLAAYEDDCFHPVVVVVPLAVVVVVLAAVVDVVPLAVVVVVFGVVVDVIGGVVGAVVVAVVAVSAFSTAVTTLPSGWAIVDPFGTNATVISSVD
jgi:hypothetical protein